MMFTAPMRHMTAVVPGKSADAVSRKLLELGLIDFVRMEDFAPDETALLNSESPDQSVQAATGTLSRLTEDRSRLENFALSLKDFTFSSLPLSLDNAPGPGSSVPGRGAG